METLGNTLKTARKKLGLTLVQVEESLKISNAYLSQLENDKIKNPSANILYKLSKLYHIPLNDLLADAGIIDRKEEEQVSEHNRFMDRIAFSSENFTPQEREEVLRFLEYLKYKK